MIAVYFKSAQAGLLAAVLVLGLLVLGVWLVFSFPRVFFAPFTGGLGAGGFGFAFNPVLAVLGIVVTAFSVGFVWQLRRTKPR